MPAPPACIGSRLPKSCMVPAQLHYGCAAASEIRHCLCLAEGPFRPPAITGWPMMSRRPQPACSPGKAFGRPVGGILGAIYFGFGAVGVRSQPEGQTGRRTEQQHDGRTIT
jgi:hypothetical protein